MALTVNEYRFRDTKNETWEPIAYIDATPDAGYVLRILEAHLKNCEGRIECYPPSILIEEMNKAQEQRKRLLEAAIEKMESQHLSELIRHILEELKSIRLELQKINDRSR